MVLRVQVLFRVLPVALLGDKNSWEERLVDLRRCHL